jgi:hypothetical protein
LHLILGVFSSNTIHLQREPQVSQLILGVLICVDFFEIFWYFWWDFAGDHGEPEDEPAEGREDEPA